MEIHSGIEGNDVPFLGKVGIIIKELSREEKELARSIPAGD